MARDSNWQERVRATHAAWVNRHVDAAPFDRSSTPGSDYNLHHLDVDATPEQDDAFWLAVDGLDSPEVPSNDG